MKRFFLFIAIVASSSFLNVNAQCVKSWSGTNNGAGDCPTEGSGNNQYYPGYLNIPSNNEYKPSGKIIVYFHEIIPAGTPAPAILEAGPEDANGGIVEGQKFDYLYAPKETQAQINSSRNSVTYCYYAKTTSNNIFNGTKAPKLVFIIKYSASNTSTSCGGVVDNSELGALPVSFKSFTATRNKERVNLKWETAMEQSNRGFYLQRNTKGTWDNIAFVFSQAVDGNSSSVLNYEYKDVNNEKGVSQYRIQQVDIDGKFKFSEIRMVRGEEEASKVLVFPNPSMDGSVNIVFDTKSITRSIIISDMSGRTIRQMNNVSSNHIVINNLQTGVYSIKIINLSTSEVTVEKVIVKKR